MWYDKLCQAVRLMSPLPNVLRWLDKNRDRIIYTTKFIQELGLTGKYICEIGPGGIGLACVQELEAKVDAYDCDEWFKPVCEQFSIPWNYIDLNYSAIIRKGPYDAILLCEVIEHIARWPAEVLSELRGSLKVGGVLLITTQNLHRLSNRMRMLFGKRLFAHFVPEELMMAHLREYTTEELTFLFQRAGFKEMKWKLLTFSDIGRSQLIETAYKIICRVFPYLSNYIFCWALKPNNQDDPLVKRESR